MGAQGTSGQLCSATTQHPTSSMAPMKAMKAGGKAMTKGAIADAVATKCELKKSVAAKVLNELAEIGTAEVKKAGIFTLPGLCRIKARKREIFGKMTIVKAKPAKKIVKAFPVAALKASHAAAVASTSVLRGSAHGTDSALAEPWL